MQVHDKYNNIITIMLTEVALLLMLSLSMYRIIVNIILDHTFNNFA